MIPTPRHRPRPIGLASLMLVLAGPAALCAQSAPPAPPRAEGRWRFELRDGVPDRVAGELRLTLRGTRLSGRMGLETRDSAAAPLTEGTARADGSVEFVVTFDKPVRFTGRLVGDSMTGVAREASGTERRWAAGRLADAIEYYPVLPRFTLRQIVAGSRDSVTRIPGRWLAAATREAGAGGIAGAVRREYETAAARAELAALTPAELAQGGAFRPLGLTRRTEMSVAVRATLASIRDSIADPAVRARFDVLFRPSVGWQVDVHDVALAGAKRRLREASWEAAVPALRVGGWMSGDSTAPASEAVPLAMQRFIASRATDSAGFEVERQRMRQADSTSALAVEALLAGYGEAFAWEAEAVTFFLRDRWVPTAAGARSLADVVRAAWAPALGAAADSLAIPRVRLRLFGYPQAVPHMRVTAPLFDAILRPDNWTATEWIERNGPRRLLAALRRIPLDYGVATTVQFGGETLRLTTVQRLAQESLNGFLEPDDEIVLDPWYVPVLAVGTVVHEWQHIIFERERLSRSFMPGGRADVVTLPETDVFLAEGFAEWWTERLLAPVEARFPLLGVTEREKRARLVGAAPNEEHVLGYALVASAARAAGSDGRAVALLLDNWASLAALAKTPDLARAWRAGPAGADLVVTAATRRTVVPEITFTLEDGYPDVVSVRIIEPR